VALGWRSVTFEYERSDEFVVVLAASRDHLLQNEMASSRGGITHTHKWVWSISSFVGGMLSSHDQRFLESEVPRRRRINC